MTDDGYKLRPDAETADEYKGVVVQLSPRLRVIICRHEIQWIIQVRKGYYYGRPRWHGIKFNRWRKDLIASCMSLNRGIDPEHLEILLALPEILRKPPKPPGKPQQDE